MDSQPTLIKRHENTQTSLMKRKKLDTASQKGGEEGGNKKKLKSSSTPRRTNERVTLRKRAWGGALELLSCPIGCSGGAESPPGSRTGRPGEPRSKRRGEFCWVLIRVRHLYLHGWNSLLLFYHAHGSEGPTL